MFKSAISWWISFSSGNINENALSGEEQKPVIVRDGGILRSSSNDEEGEASPLPLTEESVNPPSSVPVPAIEPVTAPESRDVQELAPLFGTAANKKLEEKNTHDMHDVFLFPNPPVSENSSLVSAEDEAKEDSSSNNQPVIPEAVPTSHIYVNIESEDVELKQVKEAIVNTIAYICQRTETLDARLEKYIEEKSKVGSSLSSLITSVDFMQEREVKAKNQADELVLKLTTEILMIEEEIKVLEKKHDEYEKKLKNITTGTKDNINEDILRQSSAAAASSPSSALESLWDSTISVLNGVGLIAAGAATGLAAVSVGGVVAGLGTIFYLGAPLSVSTVIGSTIGVVTSIGGIPAFLVGWTTTGTLVIAKLTGATAESIRVLEDKQCELLEAEQKIFEHNIKEASKIVEVLEWLDPTTKSETIDFGYIQADIDREINAANDNVVLSGYHSLHSLSSNICVESLKSLKKVLMQYGDQLSEIEIQNSFIPPLLHSLKEWAISESGSTEASSLYDAYKKMLTSAEVGKAQYEFVKYCAELYKWDSEGKQDINEWKHNCAEKIVAAVLLSIMNGDKPGNILQSLNDACNSYIEACREQVQKDVWRESILLNFNGDKVIVNDANLLRKEIVQELSNSQIGFMRFLCDQGKSFGVFNVVATLALSSKALGGVQALAKEPEEGSRTTCLIMEGEKVYAVLASVVRKTINKKGESIEKYDPNNPDHGGLITTTMIYDISNLGDEEFIPGFGREIPMRLVVKCTKSDMKDLQIPERIKRETAELDSSLEAKVLGERGFLMVWKKYNGNKDSSSDQVNVPIEYTEQIIQCEAELGRRLPLPHLNLSSAAAAYEPLAEDVAGNPPFINVNLSVDENGVVAVVLGEN